MIRLRLLVAVVFAVAGVPMGSVNAIAAAPVAKTIRLTVTGHGRVHAFRIEVARTEAEQERGLMFRTHIPRNGGMLFPFKSPRVASFWMKDCPVPEDMIFVRADGRIARIAAQTVPYSLDPVSSGEPVVAVLEIAGGRAAELGIVEGDKVNWAR